MSSSPPAAPPARSKKSLGADVTPKLSNEGGRGHKSIEKPDMKPYPVSPEPQTHAKNARSTVTERSRRRDPLPQPLRKEISECARALVKNYAQVFERDRRAKEKVIRLMRGLLPPKPRRRGRPRNPLVTRAIALYRRLRGKIPEESPRQLWSRVYPLVIPDWETKSDIEQRDARDELRERILWRRRKRRVRKIPAQIAAS